MSYSIHEGSHSINQALPVIHQEWKEFLMSLQFMPLQKRKSTLDQWIQKLKMNQETNSQEWEFYCLLVSSTFCPLIFSYIWLFYSFRKLFFKLRNRMVNEDNNASTSMKKFQTMLKQKTSVQAVSFDDLIEDLGRDLDQIPEQPTRSSQFQRTCPSPQVPDNIGDIY